jgi:putative sigma-54 modulation protein
MNLGMLPRATPAVALHVPLEWSGRVTADVFQHGPPQQRRRFMQVNITFRHLDSTEALKSHARDKVQHIQRYIDRPTEAHVVLYVENLEHKADINLKAGPFLLRGHAKSNDMYASIDAAAEKIERQLKKHKEKLNNHKTVERANGQRAVDVTHEVFEVAEAPSRRVVKSETFQAKTMSLDEAVLQLELLNSQFFVFQNAKDHAINIVYRREDGKVGLIEARSA